MTTKKRDFWDWFDHRVAEAMAHDDGKAFAAAGLDIQHTGGGCMAWQIVTGRWQVLVTDDDGTALFGASQWYVGATDDDGDFLETVTASTTAEAIRLALELRDKLAVQ